MTTTTRGGGRRTSLVLALVAALLATGAVVTLTVGLLRDDPAAPPTPPAPDAAASGPSPDTSPPSSRAEPKKRQQSEEPLDYSEPTRIDIPGLQVSSQLVDLGLDADGVMETPEPVDQAGWFTPSPPPGVRGATVIAGHVTWDQQPSVFFRLGELAKGDRVEVARRDGVTVVYEVTRIATFAKDQFPTEAVYAQPDRPELRLITCGGEFDQSTGRYPDNVIVWAHAVDTRNA